MGDTKEKMDWFPTGQAGIRYRKHPTRKHGIRYDRYFALHYKLDGKLHDAGLGWESQGITLAEAQSKLAEYKKHHLRGAGPINAKQEKAERKATKKAEEIKNMTVDKFYQEYYLPEVETSELRKDFTNKDENLRYLKWIKPVLGDKQLSKIGDTDIQRIKHNLEEHKINKHNLSPRTIQYTLSILRHIFNVAREKGFIDKNPVSFKKKSMRVHVNNGRKNFLEHGEADLILTELKKRSEQTYNIALLSLNSGMRFGEIAKLKWLHVDLDNHVIHIMDPKNKNNRDVPMADVIHEIFSAMPKGEPEEYVFKNRKGEKLTEVSNVYSRVIKDLKLNEGISDKRYHVCFHSLRHAFASKLAKNGESLFVIMGLLGHKNPQMTARYAHASQKDMVAAVRKFNASVGESPNEEKTSEEKIEALKLQLEKLGISADQAVQILTSKSDNQATPEVKSA
ncbi:MAG: site-specific integrase [Deltaproteobacteria bacterium]|nr:site-specific integrase [Deltaproteobacteria bacterium]